MTNRQTILAEIAEKHKKEVLDAERWLWKHPQTGYTEWEADKYISERFEAMGYTLVKAGNIPGFYTDIDTGKPGPSFVVMGELDALDLAGHPEAVNGMAHACGHHAQGAAMLGLAYALKEPGALDGLCGRIRLMLVPAEEMIQLEFRDELIKNGTIKYYGGKVEFMSRGFFDGMDIAMMVHGTGSDKYDFTCNRTMNGCMAKVITYKGKASHAGGRPDLGINAEYAAALGLQACNAIRETFREADHVRFHPIMKGVNCAVNIIPDEMKMESYVRATTLKAIRRENGKINRALAGAAVSLGASLHLNDRAGYGPESDDVNFMRLAKRICADLVGEDRVFFNENGISNGSSDFGDITAVMPGLQFSCAGAGGTGHGIDYTIVNPEKLCMNSVKAQLMIIDELLSDNGRKAAEIIGAYKSEYSGIKDYLDSIDKFNLDRDVVTYNEDGSITVNYV